MSIYTIERALFEVASSPDHLKRYKKSPQGVLRTYPLTDEEIDLILRMDVREIIRRGLSPMLAMRAFGVIEGRDMMHEYFRRIREE